MARIATIVLVLGMCMSETSLAGMIFKAGEIDSSKVEVGAYKENKPRRIVGKLANGVLGGGLFALAGGAVGINVGEEETYDPFINALIGGWGGYLVGVPLGLSVFDPYDQFKYSLAGSLIGGVASLPLLYIEEDLWPVLFITPFVGAAIMSELFRRPLEDRRVSIGLLPGPKGSVSAVATLRF